MFKVSGKNFLRGDKSWEVRGVTYGPFGPGDLHSGLVCPDEIRADFRKISGLGLNSIRTYELPDRGVLDIAQEEGICVLASVPWIHHVDFFQDEIARQSAFEAIRRATGELADHPALLGYSVGNEIESTLVRWLGAGRVQTFLEDLIDLGKARDPGGLFTYASYPSTEYLVARNADFSCVNVFLEDEEVFRRYLNRLQLIAGDRPLVLGEFGLDSKSNGRANQAETLDWGIRAIREAGAAGSFVFAYSDAWYRGGKEVEGWDFGIVDRSRRAKPAAKSVSQAHSAGLGVVDGKAPDWPSFTVICCSYNGAGRLAKCLQSLVEIDYPKFEVLVIDDGSSDETLRVAEEFASKHECLGAVGQEHAGLSVARNYGAELAHGEILAFIDDDAWAHPDWLRFLALRYLDPAGYVAVGGPNIFPPSSTREESCISLAPGRPSHVMLDDSRAEHIPGVNLSVRSEALKAIGGFDPRFTSAGDDVDFCWRLMDEGWEIGFSPGAVVWHAPRRTLEAYLKQQRGYGRAEALLAQKHRPRFEGMLGIRWAGAIYGQQARQFLGADTIVYRGVFGTAGFQAIYGPSSSRLMALVGTPFWLALGAVGILAGFLWAPLWVFAGGVFLINLLAAVRSAFRVRLRKPWDGWRSRVWLVALNLLQPLLRGGERVWGMLPR